mgnify:CR=1 FL=1
MSRAAELANLIGNINAGGGGVNRNVLVNGATNVSQRSVSSTGLGASAGYFTADRWKFQVANTAGRFTATQDSSVPTGKGFANSIKLACTTADTSLANTEQFIFQQKLEGQNVQGFAKGTSNAKPFALSFYVKGNANATYVVALYDEDNGRYVGKTFSVTTDWTRVEITFPADTTGALDDDNASSLELWIWLHCGPTYKGGTLPLTWASYSNANAAEGGDSFFDSTARTFFITGVQLEVGQNPTEFEHEPFDVTLKKCYRYFVAYGGEKNYECIVQGGQAQTSTRCWMLFRINQMRAVPTLSHANIQLDRPGIGGHDVTSYTLNSASSSQAIFSYADVSSGLNANESYCLIGNGASDSGRGYVRLSAEL